MGDGGCDLIRLSPNNASIFGEIHLPHRGKFFGDIRMGRRQKVAKWIIEMLPKKCMNCGTTTDLNYHHIVPVQYGGNDVPTNVTVLCGKCHDAIHYTETGKISHSELSKAGIQRARERGVKFGRPTADYESIMRLVAEHSTMFEGGDWTEGEIREVAGVQNVCYCKVKRMLKEEVESNQWNHAFTKPKMVRKVPLYQHLIERLRREGQDVASYGL